jgi:signal transduction histidine kinase
MVTEYIPRLGRDSGANQSRLWPRTCLMEAPNTSSIVETQAAHTRVHGTFTICLLSRDFHLLDSCRDAVRDLDLERDDLILIDPDKIQSFTADLLIWDLGTINWPPHSRTLTANQEQLFLVDRKRLHEFLTRMPLGPGGTLLKPVSHRTLQIFIEQALTRKRNRTLGSTEMDLVSPESNPKDVLQCLLMANLKLQEYDQDRTNFLARAVHDFRAPLMAASGYCSILLENAMGPLNHEQADLVHRIQRGIEKVTRMSAGMLQLSVGKQIARVPDLRESSLDAPLTGAIQEIESLARDKQITISLDLSGPRGALYFEPQQIEQVIVNLLENACRFTPKGGAIEVRGYPICSSSNISRVPGQDCTSAAPNAYRVDVSDSGSGIAPEHLKDIFEEYTSYGGSNDRSGGGLGLAICKMIIATHRGQIWAENTSRGARISFTLPLGQLHARKGITANTEQPAFARGAAS